MSSFQNAVLLGGLHMLAQFYPKAAPVIAAIEKYGPDAMPFIKAGIEEGPGAFTAIKASTPKLAAAISDFIQSHISHDVTSRAAMVEVENAARVVGGFGRMSSDAEKAWMDRASPISEDSRSGSG